MPQGAINTRLTQPFGLTCMAQGVVKSPLLSPSPPADPHTIELCYEEG